MLDYTLDPSMSIEEAQDTEEFFDVIQQLLEEGAIRMEIDDYGEAKFYPTS